MENLQNGTHMADFKSSKRYFLVGKGLLNKSDQQRDWTQFYDDIFSEVPMPKGLTLDVGSNLARYSRWLKGKGDKHDVVSMDIRLMPAVEDETQVRGSAENLPFADNSFDSVTSFWSVPSLKGENISEKRVLEEMIRVAREGVLVWPIPEWWVGERNNFVDQANDYLSRLLDNPESITYSFHHIPNSILTLNEALILVIKKHK